MAQARGVSGLLALAAPHSTGGSMDTHPENWWSWQVRRALLAPYPDALRYGPCRRVVIVTNSRDTDPVDTRATLLNLKGYAVSVAVGGNGLAHRVLNRVHLPDAVIVDRSRVESLRRLEALGRSMRAGSALPSEYELFKLLWSHHNDRHANGPLLNPFEVGKRVRKACGPY